MRDFWGKLVEIHKIHGKRNLLFVAGSGVQCFPLLGGACPQSVGAAGEGADSPSAASVWPGSEGSMCFHTCVNTATAFPEHKDGKSLTKHSAEEALGAGVGP